MSIDLANWLITYRNDLIADWTDLVNRPAPDLAANSDTEEAGGIATLNSTTSNVTQLYDALILAAQGELGTLNELLYLLTHSDTDHNQTLRALLSSTFELRRSTRNLLRRVMVEPYDAFALIDDLDNLFEYTVAMLADGWTAHTAELIREREFIAESLDSASAAADQRALQLKALNDISQRLSASLEASQLLDMVATNLYRLTDVAHVAIWLPAGNVSPKKPVELIVRHACGTMAEQLFGMKLTANEEEDITSRAFVQGKIQFEIAPDPSRQHAWYQEGCGVLALPIMINDQAIGVVTMQDPDPVPQLRFQQDLTQGVISQAAIALQNARLYTEVRALNVELEQRVEERTRELQEEKDRLATIHAISTEVSSTLDLNMLLTTSLSLLVSITQAEHASIMLVEADDSSLLVTRAVHGAPANPGNYVRFPIGAGIAGWAAQQRKPVLVNDLSSDNRWLSIPGGSLRKRRGSMIAIPLIVQGQVLGVLSVSHRQTGFFQEGHMRLLSACGGAIAIGVNNANLFQMISAEAERRYELLDYQQKEASQTAAILQSLSDGVIVCDLSGSVLTANLAAANILGRGVEELLLWNLHDILARYLAERTVEMPLDELLARPHGHAGLPRMFTSLLKVSNRTISMTMGPVLRDGHELLGALLVVRDITREIEADRLKTEFIGTMSHELRTPMTAIKGFTQLLAMGSLGPLNDTQKEFVGTIHNNTERMIDLINDVLDITKIESGSVDLEWRSLRMAEALNGVVNELKPLITERAHELHLEIPSELPAVRSDAYRLHQILFNLLSNAVKYTPRSGQIWIEAKPVDIADLPAQVRDDVLAEQQYIQIQIRDTGVGIDEEDLKRVFDRFYRTENPLKIEAGGTGLGLSLVKPLVALLGGRVWAESTLNVGSTFSLILPAI